ncbi:MAG: flippase [Ruminococcaceae bacterium]|nr:flippase [Oscillospiraceae bacterium]
MNIKSILKNKTAKNAGWIIGEKIVQMVVSLLVGILTTRYLGPSNYGLISYANSFTAFFAAFCTLGINSLMVKELVDNDEDEGKVIGTSIVLRAVASLLSVITIILSVSLIDYGESTTIAVVALCSLGLFFHVFDAFKYWFQRRLQSKFTVIAAFVAYLITATYRVILLITGSSVIWFALATSVDYVCLAILLFIFYKKNNGPKMSFSWSYGKDLFSRSKHFILASLMVSIYAQTDKLMLKQMIGSEDVGFYASATTINGMWCFILAAIIDSVYPSIMEAHKAGNEEEFNRKNRQLYAIIFYVSMGAAVLFNIFAELVIFILYGREFLPSAMPLRIICWYTAFSYLGVARNAWIVSKNVQKHLIKIYAAAAVANVILNVTLIPLLGASGAALASLMAQVLTGFVLPFFIKDLRPNAILMFEAIILKGIKKEK